MVNSTISIKIATLIIISMLFIESTAKQSVCLVEGDIKCPRKSRNFSSQKHRPRNSVSLTRKRSYTNGPRDFNALWPTRTIPYKISFDYSADQLSLLQKAMSSIESSTCIKFVPYSGQQDYVNIMRGKGCYSDVGRVGGEQQLSLDLDCFNQKTVFHELLHSIGFWHEHNRPDRDKFVKVIRENIDPIRIGNFKISDEYASEPGSWDYDYYSVMHYKYTDYSRDGKLASLLPIDTKVRPEDLGSSTFLTKQDISKINTLYRCETNSCPQPNLNAHVIIKSSTDFNIGSKVTYSCDASGFSLVGSSTQICLSTGSWSGQRPRCVPVVSHYCDFESTDCGWIAASGDVDWEISSGRKHYRAGTGPLTDLTLGTLDGHFLRLDTQNLDAGLKAIIATPNLPLSSSGVTFCLDFGYYMWGLVVGSLRVNLVTQSGSTQLFSKSGASGPKWLEKRIPFTPDGSFKLEFVATIGSELGDIAIDDVSIEPCSSGNQNLARLSYKVNVKSRRLTG